MLDNEQKILQAIQAAREWLIDNKPRRWELKHLKHDFAQELAALQSLEETLTQSQSILNISERQKCVDQALGICIRETRYHQHSFLRFLYEKNVKIKGGTINQDFETDVKNTQAYTPFVFWQQKPTEARKQVYDKVLSDCGLDL